MSRTAPVRARRRRLTSGLAVVAAAPLLLSACGGSGFDDAESSGSGNDDSSDGGSGELSVLIGSSGDAETEAVKDAVAAWSDESGTAATVTVASDLPQQLSQGFAAGNPPDVFYVSTDTLAGYVANDSLHPYGDTLSNADAFYPSLREAFTVDDEFYCAPKDFSTLALVINNRLWKAAGLTDADVPTSWEELQDVATKLTSGDVVGLGFSPEYQRVGSFFPQAGGSMLSEDGSEATVDSAENLEALTFVKSMLSDGVAAYSSDLGAGWGGEAFGKELSAMTIEGNWLIGAMKSDFPDVDYTVAELPAGPSGQGTLAFTNCWGIAADSGNQDAAVDLVENLTSEQAQLDFADAFGVIPSVQTTAETWAKDNPTYAPFIAGAEYAQNPPAQQGAADVIADFNAQLEALDSAEPEQILTSVQDELQAALDSGS